MASDTSGKSGCAEYGCGCFGISVVLVMGVIAVGVAAFYVDTGLVSGAALLFSGAVFLVGGIVFGAVLPVQLHESTSCRIRTMGTWAIGAGSLFVATAIGLTLRSGGVSLTTEIPAKGGTVGPITVENANARVFLEVEQQIEAGDGRRYERWSFVTVTLLDERQNYLSSFGGEFWHYAGYDDEGQWEDEANEYRVTLRFPSPGTYYVRLETETNVDASALSPVHVDVEEQVWWGTPAPLQAGGYIALFLGGTLWVASVLKNEGTDRDDEDDGFGVTLDVDPGGAGGTGVAIGDGGDGGGGGGDGG